MEAVFEREVADLAKPYSPLRSGCSKWASIKLQSRLKSGLSYEIQELDGESVGLVNKSEEGVVIGYRLESLKARLAVKRSHVVFLGVYSVWKLVNPFALKGLSKPLYTDLLTTLYQSVFSVSEDFPELQYLVAHDAAVDYGEMKGLVFAEFYHGLFACVDSFAKSKLASEYVRVINKLAEVVSSTNWLDSKDLHSRIHLTQDLPKPYEQWMRPFLRDLHAPLVSPPARRLESIRSIFALDSPASTKRTATAPVLKGKKPLDTSRVYTRKVELLLEDPKPRRWRTRVDTPQYFGTSSVPQLKYRVRFKALQHLTLISPLSKASKRDKKESNLLEDVLHKRSQESFPRLSPLVTDKL